MIEILLWSLAGALAVATLPGTIELAFLTIGAMLPSRKEGKSTETKGSERIAIVIPAHNESRHIIPTLNSLRRCQDPNSTIIVIADNCTDDTQEMASSFGMRVLERHDLNHVGKGYALQHAFEVLMPEGYQYFVVVDADTIVADNFIETLRGMFAKGAQAVQVRYAVLNATETMRTRLQSLAFAAINYLRPLARERWGLSVGILGNGFALSAKILREVPYVAHSIVEDLEYHLLLVQAGYRVHFTAHTVVKGIMPTDPAAVSSQRVRWEGGRFRMACQWIPRLLQGILAGQYRLIEPLLDLLLLPLALHILLLVIGFFTLQPFFDVYFLIALIISCVYVCTSWVLARCSFKELIAIPFIPFYVGWKLGRLLAIIVASRSEHIWKRTDRKS